MTAELADYERMFRRAGLPLFILDFSATRDVLNRFTPLFALVFVGEMVLAAKADWSVAANIAASIAGLAILVVAFGLVNLARGRPFLALPDRFGWPELAVFALAPAVLPLIFGGQLGSALATVVGNVALVGLVYVIWGYGLPAIVRWTGRRLVGQLATSLALLARALAPLLIFALVLFVNTEMWQVFSTMSTVSLLLVRSGLAAVALVFLAVRITPEVRRIEAETDAGGPPLHRREKLNVGLVMMVSQALQVLVATVGVAALFVGFGAIAIGPQIIESWGVPAPRSVVAFDLLGQHFEITEALLRVAGGIAAFTGLYFAIAVVTDSSYPEEFFDGIAGEMREIFIARTEYLRMLTAQHQLPGG
jgi:hypothetical protein